MKTCIISHLYKVVLNSSMCGILCTIGDVSYSAFSDALELLKPRGPDDTLIFAHEKITMGFNRLIINGSKENGKQPMVSSDSIVMANAEIFNHSSLNIEFRCDLPHYSSDCSILPYMFQGVSFPFMCTKIHGEFAIVAYNKKTQHTFVARDPHGVRPLFWGVSRKDGVVGIASEMKALAYWNIFSNIQQVLPGHFMIFDPKGHLVQYDPYTSPPPKVLISCTDHKVYRNIQSKFIDAVIRRRQNDKIGFLLSGGLDSSLVAAVYTSLAGKGIPTFSIGIEGSTDCKYADMVAKHIESDHTHICLKKEDFINAVEKVIKVIESYDVTTVRASTGNYLVGKYIAENTNLKVVMNGDYADEVCGGYLYMKLAPDRKAFHEECCRLVKDCCYFDSLRSDRTICCHGLEARAPFADKDFVDYYLSVDPSITSPRDAIEKYGLRMAFKDTDILPYDVLWRRKEAFSDGVSSTEDSWHSIMSEHAKSIGYENEEDYYKCIFDSYYGIENRNVIPYKWMPKWSDTDDPSARTLSIY